MIRTKKQKIITLSIVFVAVLVLSIGFAVYSNSLYIKAKLSVNPNVSESYSVVFSKSATSVTTGSVTPTVTGEATAEAATIDNSYSEGPTLSTLNATFKSLGDSVTYTLYAYNNSTGVTDPAYLTSINFLNAASGSTFKVCTAEDSANQESVDSACNSINVTVTVGTDSATNATKTITNHTLAVGASEKVTVTITYASDGAEATGNFTVDFGDISLYYSDGSTSTSTNADYYELGGEGFYTLEETDTTVTLLAAKNITLPTDLATELPVQSDDAGTTYFSSNMYWGKITYTEVNTSTTSSGENSYTQTFEYNEGYGSFIYDSNSNLYNYVEAYKTYLENQGVNVIQASLPNGNLIKSLSNCEMVEYGIYECNMPDWLTSPTNYWTGNFTRYWDGWENLCYGIIGVKLNTVFEASYSSSYGIRPVIIVNKSDLS